MKVIFSHGKESGPWGSKIKKLANLAKKYTLNVESIDYTETMDPDLRVEKLIKVLRNEQDEFLLVGSSMGGYVSLVASEQIQAQGLFLLAPALYIPDYKKQTYQSTVRTEIVHGWSDDIIPFENSVKYAKQANCSLHLISGDHRLYSSLDVVEKLFEQFLLSCLNKETVVLAP